MIGKRLAEERRRLGYSQQSLAEIMGFGRSALAMVETGKTPIDIGRLVNLGAHGVDVIYVITGEVSSLAAARLINWNLVESILRGIRAWSTKNRVTLTPDKEALVLKLLYIRFAASGVVDEGGVSETLRLAA